MTKIAEGQVYVRRDGTLTPPLKSTFLGKVHYLEDTETEALFLNNEELPAFIHGHKDSNHDGDLVEVHSQKVK